MNQSQTITETNFDKSGFYATILILLTLLGFWPSFFSKYVDGTADFDAYFHFHGAMATAWIGMLIVQPLLIRYKKVSIHRAVGKLSYVLLPLFFVSIILLKHHTLGGRTTEGLAAGLWLQVKDIVIMGVMFGIAIANRKNLPVHARAMISTGIVFIEPTLGRFIISSFFPGESWTIGLLVTIFLMYLLLGILICKERKQVRGRWVFPLLTGMYLLFHSLLIFRVSFPWWEKAVEWFVKLPLT